jgi:hypothetical protein
MSVDLAEIQQGFRVFQYLCRVQIKIVVESLGWSQRLL